MSDAEDSEKAEGGRQKAESRRQKAEGGGLRVVTLKLNKALHLFASGDRVFLTCFLPSAFRLPPSAFCLPLSAFCLLPSAF